MIAGRKEVSKFIDWAADIKFADFSVWGHAQTCAASGGDGRGEKMGILYFSLLLIWRLLVCGLLVWQFNCQTNARRC